MDALRKSFCPPCSVASIDGDGNCQFKALSTSCFGTDNRHARIRRTVCDYMEKHWDEYKDSVTTPNYVSRMRNSGTWGDHLTLDAFCNAYDQQVIVVRPQDAPTLMKPRRTSPEQKDWKAVVYSNSHYSACQPWFATPTDQYIERCLA